MESNKNDIKRLIHKTEIDSKISKPNLWNIGRRDKLGGWDELIHKLLYIKGPTV